MISACFSGTRITLRQCSPESEDIYDLIVTLYHHCKGDWRSAQQQAKISDDELNDFLNYAAQFLGNCGNYKSFGDVKFFPRLVASKFKALASISDKALKHYRRTNDAIYAADAGLLHFGYPDAGHVSNYYPGSPDITQAEILHVSQFLDGKGLLPENTRLKKTKSGNFEVLVASAQKAPASEARDVPDSTFTLDSGLLRGRSISLVYGDHAMEMTKAAAACKEAQKYAANNVQRNMMNEYARSFETGSYEAMKESQRFWIKDKGPTVETNIGFVETYRDPHGIRGEWRRNTSVLVLVLTPVFSQVNGKGLRPW